MEKSMQVLKSLLKKCESAIHKGCTTPTNNASAIEWLNGFCALFLQFTNNLHKFISTELHNTELGDNVHVETIFLCLTQIVNCIKHLERTIKAEEAVRGATTTSRDHFLGRIQWCMARLRVSLGNLAPNSNLERAQLLLDEKTFVELMDLTLDGLTHYSSYQEDSIDKGADEIVMPTFSSNEIRSMVDLILGHTLAFANVALDGDKKALSALCQKVHRECISFQDECVLGYRESKPNDCNRKLKARSLENALYQLENYINEALLRLVYTCFLDYSKFSIEKLRTKMRVCDPDDSMLDELIADFDVNVDRTIQIGIFAMAFAPNIKIKTIVRSCLASLESLDSCIIPSLQTKNSSDIHSEILEQHFNEEIANFKNAIQEIIDSNAFTASYNEITTQCIAKMEQKFNKSHLQEIVQMGEFLIEHFQLKINYNDLRKDGDRHQLFEKFTLMLRECQAILMCADQVDKQRILKRFKILRSVLNKFSNALNGTVTNAQDSNTDIFVMSEECSDSQHMFESIGISPSIQSILYNERPMRRRATNDSLKGNYSKLRHSVCESPLGVQERNKTNCDAHMKTAKLPSRDSVTCKSYAQQRRLSVRRQESLRTVMFKRQKSIETEKAYVIYKRNSASFQISEILDQLTGLSSNFSVTSN